MTPSVRLTWIESCLLWIGAALLLCIPLSVFGIFPYQVLRYTFACVVVSYFFLTNIRGHGAYSSYFVWSAAIVFVAVAVGFINLFRSNGNTPSEWVEYSFLYVAAVFSFHIGWSASLCAGRRQSVFLGFVALGDFAAIFSKIATVGISVRSSTGATPILPFLMDAIQRKAGGRIVNIALFGLHTIVVISAGLRSLLVSVASNLYYLFRGKARIVLAGTVIAVAIAITGLPNTLSTLFPEGFIGSRIYLIETRFRQTLFSEQGLRLDPGVGRYEESQLALSWFMQNVSLQDYIVGRGYGFTYNDFYKGEMNTAHVHITMVAAYLREGVLGVLRYLWLVVWALFVFGARFISMNPRSWESAVVVVLVGYSLISGYLLDPIYWILIGYSMNPVRKFVDV